MRLALLLLFPLAAACTDSHDGRIDHDTDRGQAADVATNVPADTATDVPADTAADAAADAAADVMADAAQPDVDPWADTDPSPDATPPAAGCRSAGGICIGAGNCEGGGGVRLRDHDGECGFDDELPDDPTPGECCMPPQAKATGGNCPDHGGLCAPVGGCNMVGGAYAANSSACPAPTICCVPETVCGEEDKVCCGESASFRPDCDRGTWTCEDLSGTTLVPEADCTFE